MLKDYSDYIGLNAIEQIILEDIRNDGESQGWNGDFETFRHLQNKLIRHNVKYKYLGRWEKNTTM